MKNNYRYLLDKINNRDNGFGAIVLTGSRRAGKSTIGQMLLDMWGGGHVYSFDTPDEIDFFKRDPQFFINSLKVPALLDEVQNVPEIFNYIKSNIDIEQKSNHLCNYILTGSQQFQVMKKVTESLAGRALIKDLYPFCAGELLQLSSQSIKDNLYFLLHSKSSLIKNHYSVTNENIYTLMLKGGYFPAYHAKDYERRNEWFRSFVRTYIQRDVRDLSNIQDLGLYDRFVSLIAGRTGNILNYSELGKDIGVNYKTAQNYLSILETSYLWRSIRPYFSSTEKRLTKSPKGIMLDSGLACFLTGIYSEESLQKSPQLGGIFETYVISELIKLTSIFFPDVNFYYFRDSANHEVDLVLEYMGKLIPVEIKCSGSSNSSWGKGIQALKKLFTKIKIDSGVVLSLDPQVKEIASDVWNVPISAFFGNEI